MVSTKLLLVFLRISDDSRCLSKEILALIVIQMNIQKLANLHCSSQALIFLKIFSERKMTMDKQKLMMLLFCQILRLLCIGFFHDYSSFAYRCLSIAFAWTSRFLVSFEVEKTVPKKWKRTIAASETDTFCRSFVIALQFTKIIVPCPIPSLTVPLRFFIDQSEKMQCQEDECHW